MSSQRLDFHEVRHAQRAMRCFFAQAIAVLFLTSCFPKVESEPLNQSQGVVSPNGMFVLRVPIEPQTTNPVYKGTGVWKVTIFDLSENMLYKDEDSTMVGALMVYWGWDDNDRVWVYNSDDGRIWRWEWRANNWEKIESSRADGIPDYILPDYAKETVNEKRPRAH